MITVELMGGLGNQMFQYAFGLRLATERHTGLVANGFLLNNRLLATLRQYTYRQFELSIFGVEAPGSSPASLLRAASPFHTTTRLIREPAAGPRALLLPPLTVEQLVCVGYWQSEGYFKAADLAVRQQFQFRQPVNDFTQRVAEAILKAPNPVFVHVRRGDYVTNANASQHHGVCGIDYYKQALTHMRERVDSPNFYVFSDDLDWVKQELGPLLQPATYVEGNRGRDSWQDMFLMSHCRHAIMANSSFSWWGAWLNDHPGRIVTAPRQWFTKQVTENLLPDHWISL